MENKIIFTVTKQKDIFHYHITDPKQSVLAQSIISKIKNQLNINVFALYAEGFSKPIWDYKYPKFIPKKINKYHYQKNLHITIYYIGTLPDKEPILKERIYDIFQSELLAQGVEIPYPKSYSNLAELEYFTQRDSDEEKYSPEYRDGDRLVFLHSFENEARDYILLECIPKYEAFIKNEFNATARIIPSYDKNSGRSQHKICFLLESDKKLFEAYDRKELHARLTEFIKRYDCWNVVSDYNPIFTLWNNLKDDEKFIYSKGF